MSTSLCAMPPGVASMPYTPMPVGPGPVPHGFVPVYPVMVPSVSGYRARGWSSSFLARVIAVARKARRMSVPETPPIRPMRRRCTRACTQFRTSSRCFLSITNQTRECHFTSHRRFRRTPRASSLLG